MLRTPAIALLLAVGATAQIVPDGFTVDTLLSDSLIRPTDLCFLPDGRCLIATNSGTIVVYAGGAYGAFGAVPSVSQGGESGLLSIVADPQFTTNGQDREKPKFLQSSRNLAYTWNPAGPPGNKVDFKSIRVDGKALKPRTTIRVVCNAYLAAGGDDYPVLARGTDRRIGIYDIDAFVHYLAKHAPVGPPPAHAIRSKR